jgi:hypothetical protein
MCAKKKQTKDNPMADKIVEQWKLHRSEMIISPQSNLDKNKTNFAPGVYYTLAVNFSESNRKCIDQIKREFGFRNKYDLTAAIEQAVNWYTLEMDVQRQEAPPNVSKKQLSQIIEYLQHAKELPILFEELGSKIRGVLIDILNENSDSRYRRAIRMNGEEILVDETIHRTEELIETHSELIDRMILACSRAIKRLPKATHGRRPASSMTKRFIPHLAKIYEDGTGNLPVAEWNREDAEVMGEFPSFIIKLSRIFKESSGLDLGRDDSLVEYAKRYWRARKEKSD